MYIQKYTFIVEYQNHNRIFSDYLINILHENDFKILLEDVEKFRTNCE